MKRFISRVFLLGAAASLTVAQARVVTVTTVNNVSPGAGQTSLLQALSDLQNDDVIQFNIPGTGPHVIQTPDGGYPLITKNNVTINGYTQPGSAPNTNPILAANNAQIQIVLDSSNGNARLMDFVDPGGNDNTGYGDSEAAVLGLYGVSGFKLQGVSILGALTTLNPDVSLYGVSFAHGASGQVCGCWIGVNPDGTTLAVPADAITGFRYQVKDDSSGAVTETILVDNVVVGVSPTATAAPAEFNVLIAAAIPVIIEGQGSRISGNFLNVLPSGVADYNPAYDPLLLPQTFEGAIEIGRSGNNTLIGVDGDGVNDASERNVFGGVVPSSLGGYDHTIEFYSQSPGTNIVIAGNYIGVGVDGATWFTNGVPAINAAGGSAVYRIGSNLDGVSDDVEGNVIFNNRPFDLFPSWDWANYPQDLNFFDELATGGMVSLRGNSLVNNFAVPASPLRSGGVFLTDYYTKALADPAAGVVPTLDTNLTTLNRLVGTVPLADTTTWPTTLIDFYAADPIGITNGQAAFIPELPWGMLQGWRYMTSFVDNGPEDRDAVLGKFDIDISAIELKGTYLTVTANYSKALATNPKDPTATILTSPFSEPAEVVFSPGSVESVGLRYLVKDTILNKDYLLNNQLNALGNWEPYCSVLGTSTFLIEGNTFAEDTVDMQRYVVALQPADGSAMKLGEGFYSDNGQPYRGQINISRQNGNPGRVGGDKRPGASNFMVGGEASPHMFPDLFNSDSRWNGGMIRTETDRYGTVQIFSLDTTTLIQTPLTKAFDVNLGRVPDGSSSASAGEVSRFGGEIVCLDNGNFVVVIDDRSNLIAPFRAPTAVIVKPDGTVVKETYEIGTESDQIWSNVAAYQGGFAAKFHGMLYFYDNDGNLQGSVDQDTSSGELFDRGRSDGTRIAAHINSPYVFLAGKVTSADSVRVCAWDSRTRTFVAKTEVSEPAFPGNVNRVNMTVDALNRMTVAWDSKPPGYPVVSMSDYYHTAARVLALDGTAKTLKPLTSSFLAFYNSSHPAAKNADCLIRNWRPTIAMTTRQIMIAAKGELNSQLKPELNIDTPREVNYYVVITHPAPTDDPTTPVGGANPTLTVGKGANTLTLGWAPATAGFKLYSTPSLTAPAWTLVGTGTQNPTTDTIGTGNKFYQLRK